MAAQPSFVARRARAPHGSFILIDGGAYAEAFGVELLHAQVELLIKSFRYEWSLSLVIFGIHVALLGYLVARSGYIPRVLGILLVIAGLGYMLHYLSPYLLPGRDMSILFVTFLGELVFGLWLLIRGWKIPEPARGAGC
jgi:hypothetical protein